MRRASCGYMLSGSIWLLSVVALGAQDASRPQDATPADALARLRAYIGANPTECGRHEQSLAAADAVTASARCVIESARRQLQSWMFVHAKGADSWTATGVLSGSDGVVRRFFYDSKPPTGRTAPLVEVVPCAAPKILVKQSGNYAGFDCSSAASR